MLACVLCVWEYKFLYLCVSLRTVCVCVCVWGAVRRNKFSQLILRWSHCANFDCSTPCFTFNPYSPFFLSCNPYSPSLSLWLFLNCKFLLIYFDSTFRMFYSCALGDPQNAINIFIHLNVCKPKTISANSTKFLKKEQHCKLSFIVNNLKFSAHFDHLLAI